MMAIQAFVATEYGEELDLYIRLNNVEINNHGELSRVKFRGFLSKEAFQNGKRWLWEKDVEFLADVKKPIWEQAYKVLMVEIGSDNYSFID